MRYRDAKKLHPGDEVTVKKTKNVCTVIEIETVPGIVGMSLYLSNGRWYGYKEVK